MSYNIAVVGATGNVGREMLETLIMRDFPVGKVYALASERSVGKKVSFGDTKTLPVENLATFDFSKVDIGLFSPGASVSKEYAPKAAAAGCVVIDNTSYFRMQENIPLVVPEVNPEALKNFAKTNIIANPNCSTIQMVVALKPLHDAAKIKRVVVSTYQSVSGAGKDAMDELYDQTKRLYVHEKMEPTKFTRQIAFNVIPHIDVFMDGGDTKEEWKMRVETQKILDPNIAVSATCVRVPVFIGHAESVNVEFETPLSPDQAREILQEAPGIILNDSPDDLRYTTPLESVGEEAVYVSRIRKDPSNPNALNMWIVADNLLKGAALNAVQIAETLISQYGLKAKAAA
ncbi:MAG: aspartate-semialdehyde dehydrogenase [Hyphomicrobiales bacterium]|nr:aspartate-semialdehyde dehydrogenase [Hyphomicrobiales bacterium]